jgi:flagellar assembly factor FliW
MKVLPEILPGAFPGSVANHFSLPNGLIGFKDHTRAELLYVPDHLPFLWLKLHGAADPVHFVVVEPAGLIPDYELEIFDEDAATLELESPSDALILNIVTLRQDAPSAATVNLLGPIVVNRRTRVGRQLVIANYSRFSAHHPLVAHAHEPLRASA